MIQAFRSPPRFHGRCTTSRTGQISQIFRFDIITESPHLIENQSGCSLPTNLHQLLQVIASLYQPGISNQEYRYYWMTYLMTCPVGLRGLDAMSTAKPWVLMSFFLGVSLISREQGKTTTDLDLVQVKFVKGLRCMLRSQAESNFTDHTPPAPTYEGNKSQIRCLQKILQLTQ